MSVVNGIRPLEPLVSSEGDVIAQARTFGDAYEAAVRHAATGYTKTMYWGHSRFEVEGVDIDEPPSPVAPEWVPLLVWMRPAGKAPGYYLYPESLLEGDFSSNAQWRITTPHETAQRGGTFRSDKENGIFDYEVLHENGTITKGSVFYAI